MLGLEAREVSAHSVHELSVAGRTGLPPGLCSKDPRCYLPKAKEAGPAGLVTTTFSWGGKKKRGCFIKTQQVPVCMSAYFID